MLQLKNINVSFGSHHVLRDLSCTVEAGDFIVIVGTNGAGKSTFFDTIAGTLQPTSGHIILDNGDITAQDERERSSAITRIFQNTHLNSVGSMTVAENLALALYSRRPARLIDGMNGMSQEKAEHIMKNIGMDSSLLHKKMNQLSGGQRQLIAFTMATQLIPKVLLLDEPTAALDPQASTKLLSHAIRFIKEHAITTLVITHDPHIALSIGNKIWVLSQGKIVKEFNKEDKQHLHPEELIGQIDYASLARL